MTQAAYVIGHIKIKDQKKWDEYRSKVPETLAPWGAEILLRGQLVSALAGEHDRTHTVVIRFPDLQAANNWHNSAAYQALIALRKDAAEVDLLQFAEI